MPKIYLRAEGSELDADTLNVARSIITAASALPLTTSSPFDGTSLSTAADSVPASEAFASASTYLTTSSSPSSSVEYYTVASPTTTLSTKFPAQMLSDSTPEKTEEHIGHRNYIGVIIVAVVVAVGLLLWFLFGRSSRNLRRFCRRAGRAPNVDTDGSKSRPHSVMLTPAAAASTISSEPSSPITPVDPKSASRLKLLGGKEEGKLSPYGTPDGSRPGSEVDVEKAAESKADASRSQVSSFPWPVSLSP